VAVPGVFGLANEMSDFSESPAAAARRAAIFLLPATHVIFFAIARKTDISCALSTGHGLGSTTLAVAPGLLQGHILR